MSERDALLGGIREHPEDDSPRLVFADWLDDRHPGRGQAAQKAREWAAIIRRQVEAAQTPPTDPRYWELRPWDDKPATQAVALLPAPLRRVASYKRGFPSGLEMASRSFSKYAEAISSCLAPLADLHLTGAGVDTREIAARPELARFRRLSIRGARVRDAEVRALVRSPHVASLIGLELADRIGTRGVTEIIASPNLSELRELSLEGDLRSAALRGLGAGSTARPLEILSLAGESAADDIAVMLGGPGLANLRELSLTCSGIDERAVRALMTGALPHLTDLRIPARLLAPEPAFFASACFRGLNRLECVPGRGDPDIWSAVPEVAGPPGLWLQCMPATRASVDSLVRSPVIGRCSAIEWPWAVATIADVVTLAQSPLARHLRVFLVHSIIGNWGSGDETAMRQIAESPNLANLLELGLPSRDLTDGGLRALTEAAFAPTLRALWLGECRGLTDAEVVRLADPSVFPELRVLSLSGVGFADPVGLGKRLGERFGCKFDLR